MRTTIRLPEDLLQEAKKSALEAGTTLTGLIEESLRERLGRHRRKLRSQPVRLPTYGEGGTLPGVDLNHSSALLDLMDDLDASS